MTKIKLYLILALAAVIMAVFCFYSGYRKGQAVVRAEWQVATSKAIEKSREQEQQMLMAAAAIDSEHYKEMENAKKENDTLRLELATAAKRVRVKVASCNSMPQVANAASVDDAGATAELDPAVAAAMAGIASDGDEAIRQLTGLQEWVKNIQ